MNEKNSNERDAFQIDLWKLLQVCLRKWWVIALLGLLGAAVSLFYTANFITPLYRSSVTIYVNNNTNKNQNKEYVSGGDLSTSQQLVSTYTNMLSSDTVLEQVIQATGLDRTAAGLRGMISAEQVEDTEIFKVFVTSSDPIEAATIANAIAQTAPDVIADFVEGSSTKIIDYAKAPGGRFRPSYKRNVMIGFAGGIVLAVLLLAVQFLLDVRIREESDLTELFDIPVLGQIPDLTQSLSGKPLCLPEVYEIRNLRSLRKRGGAEENEGESAAKQKTAASKTGNAQKRRSPIRRGIGELRQRLTGGAGTGMPPEEERRFLLNGRSGFFGREAYKMLRTNLSFALAEQEHCKVVMIASALQIEGKTITASNLAITLAEAGNRVLLIECDLRCPKLGELLSLTAQVGLSDILVKPELLRENVQEYRQGLQVILAGSIPPNPSELLNSACMETLLTNLRTYYDYILLDTPPIDMVTDAAVLASHTDGVLLVVRTGRSERGAVTQAVEQLEYGNARILGFVMTCVPMENTSYAYGRHRYRRNKHYGYKRYGYGKYGYGYGYGGYGYGYGYGYGSGSRSEAREKWNGAIRDGERRRDD